MFGVAPISFLGRTGAPWLLGTDDVMIYGIPFLRRNRVFVEEMQKTFTRLENYVDARNEASKRWLSWLGFTLGEEEPHGPDGVMFHKFWKEA